MAQPEIADVGLARRMLGVARRAASLNRGKSRQDLDRDEALALATVYLLRLLGEAAAEMSPVLRSRYPEIPWEAMAATSERMAEAGLDVDLDVVWAIVSGDLPGLITRLKRLIRIEETDNRRDPD